MKKIEIKIEETESLDVERYSFILNGYKELLIEFTEKSVINIDNDRYDKLLNLYMETYIKYMIVLNSIKFKYLKKNNIDQLIYNEFILDIPNSKIIFYTNNN